MPPATQEKDYRHYIMLEFDKHRQDDYTAYLVMNGIFTFHTLVILIARHFLPLKQRPKEGENKGMPIYEFVCLSCGNDFEKLQSFSETSSPLCPACQSDQVRRRLSSPAIHFKGSGWYVTDSKNGKNGKPAAESSAKNGEKSGDADKKPASGDGEHKGDAVQKGETASEKVTKSETAGATAKDSAKNPN